jgi:hypothetical protein
MHSVGPSASSWWTIFIRGLRDSSMSMLADPVVNLQPIREAPDHVLLQRDMTDFIQLRLLVGRCTQDGEPLKELIRAEVIIDTRFATNGS